jgi:hypothetical protein
MLCLISWNEATSRFVSKKNLCDVALLHEEIQPSTHTGTHGLHVSNLRLDHGVRSAQPQPACFRLAAAVSTQCF